MIANRRLIEWQNATVLLSIGVAMMLPGKVISPGDFEHFYAIMAETMWGVLFAAIGLARILALAVNGSAAVPSNIARAVAAVIFAGIFGFMAAVFLLHSTFAVIAGPMCLSIAFYECLIGRRAVTDLRHALNDQPRHA